MKAEIVKNDFSIERLPSGFYCVWLKRFFRNGKTTTEWISASCKTIKQAEQYISLYKKGIAK